MHASYPAATIAARHATTANDLGLVPPTLLYSLAAIGKPQEDLAYRAWSRELSTPAMRVARTFAMSCPAPIDHISVVGSHATSAAGVEELLMAPAATVRSEVNAKVAAPRSVHELPASADVRRQAGRVIGEGCTTSELARRLEISAGTASHHATVLRTAGLVATQRVGSAVLHTLTPLGSQLLDGSA